MSNIKAARSSYRHSRSLMALTLALLVMPAAFAAPVGIGFTGLLEDGGKFAGYVIFGDQDKEGVSQENPAGVPDQGRFLGGFWQVDVKGGSTTADASLSHTSGGRAPVETNQAANLIFILTLGPEAGELPRLELMFRAAASYDADVQPTVLDIVGFYASFTIGAKTAFSRYQDRFGISTNVLDGSIEIFDATSLLPAAPVPLPMPVALLGVGCGLLVPLARRRAQRRAVNRS